MAIRKGRHDFFWAGATGQLLKSDPISPAAIPRLLTILSLSKDQFSPSQLAPVAIAGAKALSAAAKNVLNKSASQITAEVKPVTELPTHN